MNRNKQKIEQILKDLDKKMVFIVGPRQVGKTWLAHTIAKHFSKTVYLNYDNISDRESIKENNWPSDTDLVILDELHKMPEWKNHLKGLYDTKLDNLKILVTGSARLDTFRQAGDSLVGRFFAHHLLPFSLKEIDGTKFEGDLDRLLLRGGFPEAFLAENDVDTARWRSQYLDGLIRIDILDFENIYDFKAIQTIISALRKQVGSPVSYENLAKIASVSPTTARKYVEILEALFIIFLVPPYSRKIARAIGKKAKVYFYDTGLVDTDEGLIFENLVAISLLKHVWSKNDLLGEHNKLNYIRTKEQKEVDFVLINTDGDIDELVEVKLSTHKISKNLLYFSNRYKVGKSVQVVKNLRNARQDGNVQVVPAHQYLSGLFM